MSTKKIHPPLWDGAWSILFRVLIEGAPLDQSLKSGFKNNPKWGSKDRRLVGQMVFDTVRYFRKYLALAGENWDDHKKWERAHIAQALTSWARENAYQTPYQEPNSPVVSLSNFEKESFPDWMKAETSLEVLSALNQEAPIFLRTNLLKNSTAELARLLESHSIQFEVMGDAIKIKNRDIFRRALMDEVFPMGIFEIQDLGSQQIAPMLGVKPGDRVLDACAGNGGKTLHLAQLMKNQGQLMAADIEEIKLRQVEGRCRGAGISIVRTRLAPIQDLVFDAVLLDVPCSGLGVIRRHPERKWQVTPEKIGELVKIQADLLEHYKTMLKPGGALLYATCTFTKEENQQQVQKFLARNSTWHLEEEKIILAGPEGWDCFYAARLRFKGAS